MSGGSTVVAFCDGRRGNRFFQYLATRSRWPDARIWIIEESDRRLCGFLPIDDKYSTRIALHPRVYGVLKNVVRLGANSVGWAIFEEELSDKEVRSHTGELVCKRNFRTTRHVFVSNFYCIGSTRERIARYERALTSIMVGAARPATSNGRPKIAFHLRLGDYKTWRPFGIAGTYDRLVNYYQRAATALCGYCNENGIEKVCHVYTDEPQSEAVAQVSALLEAEGFVVVNRSAGAAGDWWGIRTAEAVVICSASTYSLSAALVNSSVRCVMVPQYWLGTDGTGVLPHSITQLLNENIRFLRL